MTTHKTGGRVAFGGHGAGRFILSPFAASKQIYEFEFFMPDGTLAWTARAENLVTTVGLNEMGNKFWKGSEYTAEFYVGLISGTSATIAAGDTMSSHAGWTEFTNYTASSPNVRPTLTLGSFSSGSADNSASKASYTIDTASPNSQAICGAFLVTDSAIGGTSGILVSAAENDGGHNVLTGGGTLNVTVTCSFTSA